MAEHLRFWTNEFRHLSKPWEVIRRSFARRNPRAFDYWISENHSWEGDQKDSFEWILKQMITGHQTRDPRELIRRSLARMSLWANGLQNIWQQGLRGNQKESLQHESSSYPEERLWNERRKLKVTEFDMWLYRCNKRIDNFGVEEWVSYNVCTMQLAAGLQHY